MVPQLKHPLKPIDFSELEKMLVPREDIKALHEMIFADATQQIKRKDEFLSHQFLMLVRKLKRNGKIKGRVTRNKIDKLGIKLVVDHEGKQFIGKFKDGRLVKRLTGNI